MFFTLKISERNGRFSTETTINNANTQDLDDISDKYKRWKMFRHSDSEIRYYVDNPKDWSVRVRILAKFS